MATLRDVMAQIQTDMLTLTDMKVAPTDPPELPQVFPFSVVMPYEGEWIRASDVKQGIQTVTLDIHVARKDMARDIRGLTEYFADAVPNKLLSDIKLGGTVDIITSLRWQLFSFVWEGGSLRTIALRFYVQFKMRSAIT